MEQNTENNPHAVMDRAELVDLMDMLYEIKFRMKKAKALHHSVVKYYFDRDVLDPFSKDDEIRWHSIDVCRDYELWSSLLDCAYDMIIETNDIAGQLIDTVHGRLEGC